MKTAGNILSALFDEHFMKTAQGYSKFFDSWTDITAKNGIAAAVDHSKIKDLDRGIILIEIDHPGWKQVLQTKQTKLLNDFRIRFPELDISGISLMLGSGKPQDVQEAEVAYEAEPAPSAAELVEAAEVVEKSPQEAILQPTVTGLDVIKDKEFREKLIRIRQNIADAEKRRK